MKVCNCCKVEKDISEFRERKQRGVAVRVGECRPCELAKGKLSDAKRRAADPAYVEANRLRSAAHLATRKATRTPLTRATCRNCKKEKDLSEFDPGKRRPTTCKVCKAERKHRAHKAGDAKADPVKRRERARNWLAENKERRAAYVAANLDKFLAYNWNRVHMKRANGKGVNLTAKVKAAIKTEQFDECAFCLAPLAGGCHFDHVVPLIKSGAHELENLQALCPSCNLRKGKMGPLELLTRRGYSIQNGPITELP